MTTLSTALSLAEDAGFFVFPVHHNEEDNTKKPLTKNGHLDATQDPGLIQDWWEKWPSAKVGVEAGRSGINVLDVDTKNGKDGWDSLAESWREIPDTFSYETGTGGSHLVYRAPDGIVLNGTANYLGMEGVDRRAGSSWVLWVGEVPSPGELTPAPDWLNEQVTVRQKSEYSGTLSEWVKGLVSGEPNAVVRKAWERTTKRFEERGNDFSHSDMTEAQFEAVRIACEGNPGAAEYIEYLEDLFLSREGSHTRPEELWGYEWEEALQSAIEKYGDMVPEYKDLPEYSIGLVPAEVPDNLVQTDTGKPGFSKLLAALVKASDDDLRIASILWNCPATTELAHEWGFLFTLQRVREARVKPEPTRENPRLEEVREDEAKGKPTTFSLLTDEEREYIAKRPTFVDQVVATSRGLGYDQDAYFRSIAWNLASMAFGRRAYVPLSATQVMGLNIWQIVMGWSGTGKSVADAFQTDTLDILMDSDTSEVPYDLGADSSIQGLHLALLQRDNLPSLFSSDEASGWFKRIKSSEWNSGMEDLLADWYMGRVSASNKINLKELRGKSATTSLNLHMFATPDRLVETLTRDQFMSGFLARVMWTFGNPRVETDEMFDIFKDSAGKVENVEIKPVELQTLAADLMSARTWIETPVALKPTSEAKERMAQAYKEMYSFWRGKKNWDLIEPSITRHVETMAKAAGICAVYRADEEITLEDALHAIQQVEEWVKNLVRVAELISQGDWQRNVNAIEEWIKSRKNQRATRAQVFHQFKNMIQKDGRELDGFLSYLVESGSLNREDANGAAAYVVNGGG